MSPEEWLKQKQKKEATLSPEEWLAQKKQNEQVAENLDKKAQGIQPTVDIDGVAICTGYRGMPERNSKTDYKVMREYEEKASGKTPEEKRALLKEFIEKCRTNK